MKYTPNELASTFTELLRTLRSTLDDQAVPWMLIGGLAVSAWTEPRGTKDCDLALALPDDLASFSQRLTNEGFVISRGALEQAIGGGSVRLRYDSPNAVSLVVDLLCAGTEFERSALGRRRQAEVFGVPIWIVTPDDLVIYKLVAARPQHLADVDKLFRFGRAPEDETYLRKWAKEWQIEDRLDRALAIARAD